MRLDWKIYRDGILIASAAYASDAAAIVGPEGGLEESTAVVKWRSRFIVWREGKEEFSASESYDGAGEIMLERAFAGIKRATDRLERKGRR